MAYIKNTWEDHVTPIDAQHMNHMEEGIEQAAAAADAAQAAADEKQPKGDYALKNELPAVPTKLTAFENDAGFITKAANDLANYFLKSETYSREEVQQLLSTIPKFTIQVVDALPAENISDSTVYLLASGEDGNLYTEYIYVNGVWEMLGSQHMAIVQSDWNQNDPEAADYVKGRTHYIEKNKIYPDPIAEKITFTGTGGMTNDSGRPPVRGQMYFVEFDGVVYEAECRYGATMDYGVELGDANFVEYPFLIMHDTDANMCYVCRCATDGEHTYSIYQLEESVVTLPTEFLPTTVPVIPTATVGQTVVVKAVDADGKPTEWEAADVGGGGNDGTVLLRTTSYQAVNDRAHFIDCAKRLKPCYYCNSIHNGETTAPTSGVPVHYVDGFKLETDSCDASIFVLSSNDGQISITLTEDEANEIYTAWYNLAGFE